MVCFIREIPIFELGPSARRSDAFVIISCHQRHTREAEQTADETWKSVKRRPSRAICDLNWGSDRTWPRMTDVRVSHVVDIDDDIVGGFGGSTGKRNADK